MKMNKLIGLAMSALLVLSLAGPAAAYLSNDDVHLVVYSETDDAAPIQTGTGDGRYEAMYDMGTTVSYLMDMSDGTLDTALSGTHNTGIQLSDFPDAADWSDVNIGLYGTHSSFSHAILGSDSAITTVNGGAATAFRTMCNNTDWNASGTQTVTGILQTDVRSYTQNSDNVNSGGTYNGLIVTGSSFNAELELDAAGDGTMLLYYTDDRSSLANYEVIGSMDFYVSGGDLTFDFTPVPVPGTLLLLGSGLLGLIGIRRKQLVLA